MPDQLEIAGRQLSIRHLERVLYPEAGVTKKDLLKCYTFVADVMLAHLRERLLHVHR